MEKNVKNKVKEGPGRPRSDLPDVKRPNVFALWMRDAGVQVESVAKILRVTPGLVYGWRKGTRCPSLQLAIRIAEISNGAVAPSSWKEG